MKLLHSTRVCLAVFIIACSPIFLAEEGKQNALYFPDGREVNLDLSQLRNMVIIKWLDINNSNWQNSEEFMSKNQVKIVAPSPVQWVAIITDNN